MVVHVDLAVGRQTGSHRVRHRTLPRRVIQIRRVRPRNISRKNRQIRTRRRRHHRDARRDTSRSDRNRATTIRSPHRQPDSFSGADRRTPLTHTAITTSISQPARHDRHQRQRCIRTRRTNPLNHPNTSHRHRDRDPDMHQTQPKQHQTPPEVRRRRTPKQPKSFTAAKRPNRFFRLGRRLRRRRPRGRRRRRLWLGGEGEGEGEGGRSHEAKPHSSRPDTSSVNVAAAISARVPGVGKAHKRNSSWCCGAEANWEPNCEPNDGTQRRPVTNTEEHLTSSRCTLVHRDARRWMAESGWHGRDQGFNSP